MTNVASNASAAKPEPPPRPSRSSLRKSGRRGGKFSEQDLSSLKGNNDLVAQRVGKYGLG